MVKLPKTCTDCSGQFDGVAVGEEAEVLEVALDASATLTWVGRDWGPGLGYMDDDDRRERVNVSDMGRVVGRRGETHVASVSAALEEATDGVVGCASVVDGLLGVEQSDKAKTLDQSRL